MEILGAAITADVSIATYEDSKLKFRYWVPDELDEISDGGRTYGFVASDVNMTMMAFRGTQNTLRPIESFVAATRQWLTNINYAQKIKGDFRVHQGFDHQLDDNYSKVLNTARKHGADRRPFIITGHSAGGALATLAAHRLSCDNVQPDAVYVFASPRVGDGRFASVLERHSVPVYRFEQRDDIVTHLPFSPILAKVVGAIGVNALLRGLNSVLPGIELDRYMSNSVEYVHAGRLFYRDWDGDLLSSVTWTQLGKAFFSDEVQPSYYTIVPKAVLDVVRVTNTFNNVMSQIDEWSTKAGTPSRLLHSLRFLADHSLPDLQEFLMGLARKA